MASDESETEDGRYSVELILAQRVIDGTLRYLVKWEGYPDEECTWEPKENFTDAHTILKEWAERRARGDELNQEDIAPIEQKMECSKLRQAAEAQQEEAESDFVESEDDRPLKRARLVPDAPLTSKKKGTARPSRRSSSSSLDQSTVRRSKSPVVKRASKSKPASKVTIKKAAPPLFARPQPEPSLSSTNIQKNTDAKSTVRTKQDNANVPKPPILKPRASNIPRSVERPRPAQIERETSPPTFHAPDLSQRTRKAPQDVTTKRNVTGKMFKSLRQQNNARKSALADRPPPPITDTAVVSESTETTPASVPAAVTVEKFHASTLFFDSSDDDDIKPDVRKLAEDDLFGDNEVDAQQDAEEVDTQALAGHTIPQQANDTALACLDIGFIDQPGPETLSGDKAFAAASTQTLPPLSADPQRRTNALMPANKTGPPFSSLVSTILPGTTSSHDGYIGENSPRCNTDALTIHIKDRPESVQSTANSKPQRNSLFNRTLPPEFLPISISTSIPLASAQDIKVSDSVQEIDPGNTIAREEVLRDPDTKPSLRNTAVPLDIQAKDHNMRTTTKQILVEGRWREVILGDLVVHISLQCAFTTPVKLRHVDWQYGRVLYRTKQNRKILLNFDRTLTRADIEPWPDIATDMVSLATRLEQESTTAIWEHPHDDFMVLLYSCQAPSWKDFGTKPTRDSSPRLHMAIRPKFKGPGLDLLAATVQGVARPSEQTPVIDQRMPEAMAQLKDKHPDQTRRHNSIAADHPSPLQPMIMEFPAIASSSPKSLSAEAKTAMDGAMDIEPPLRFAPVVNQQAEVGQETEHTDVSEAEFAGFNANIKELSYLKPGKDKIDRSKVSILLVYSKVSEDHVQQIRNWLINNGQPWERIFHKTISKDWPKFIEQLRTTVGVILFDKYYPLTSLVPLSQLLVERDNLICWQVDYNSHIPQPLNTRRLFPRGMVLTIAEACFVNDLQVVLSVLKHFRTWYVTRPSSSSCFVFPPGIRKTVLDQAILSTQPETIKLFASLALILEEFISASRPSTSDDEHLFSPTEVDHRDFCTVEPGWRDVYKDMAKPVQGQVLPAFEQRKQDEDKEARLFKYFSSWALSRLGDYRRFVAIMHGSNKPREYFLTLLDKQELPRAVKNEQDQGQGKDRLERGQEVEDVKV
ncbi:hypothetical protein LTR05_001971 [Lithohypha guttulata]|uniref:Chromo domain-containing protein n=1 Tax=Lithohypha guttulata TaxID=1690604 RepID=A0AAN7T1P9_9EURO|nr:hypothetical protein LTR05_001971 [Lithohypha guttulata]